MVLAGLPPGVRALPACEASVCHRMRLHTVWGKTAGRRLPQPLQRLIAQGARKRGTRVYPDKVRQRHGFKTPVTFKT